MKRSTKRYCYWIVSICGFQKTVSREIKEVFLWIINYYCVMFPGDSKSRSERGIAAGN